MSVESKIMDCEMRISQYEADINEGYLNLGKAYYEAHAEATEQTGEFAELVKGISDCFSKIEIEKQIKLIVRGKRICFNCGALLTADSLFCNKCGHKLEELPKEVIKAMEEDDDDDSEEYDVDFSVTSEEEKEEGFSAEPASEKITLEDVATEETVEEAVEEAVEEIATEDAALESVVEEVEKETVSEEVVEETVSPRIIAPLVFEYKEEPVSVVTEQPSEAEENVEITLEDDIIGVPDDEVFSAQAE